MGITEQMPEHTDENRKTHMKRAGILRVEKSVKRIKIKVDQS